MQWLLPSGLFGSVVLGLWNKFVRIRPQVILRIEDGASNQGADGPNRYKFVWNRRLVLHNDSTHKARRIRLVSTEGADKWHFKGSLPDTVDPDTKQTWSFSIQHSEEREKVIALCGQEALQRHELARAFLPHVAGHAEIIIAYDNEKDTTFYTRLIIDGSLQRSALHWRKPKHTIENT
jgi:hypothetical protein